MKLALESWAASDLDSVADSGFHHKCVLEVTNAAALLGLSPLDAWKETQNKGDLKHPYMYWRKFVASSLVFSQISLMSITASYVPCVWTFLLIYQWLMLTGSSLAAPPHTHTWTHAHKHTYPHNARQHKTVKLAEEGNFIFSAEMGTEVFAQNNLCIHMYIYMYISLSIYRYMPIYLVYIIYTYIYTYKHIHIYICMLLFYLLHFLLTPLPVALSNLSFLLTQQHRVCKLSTHGAACDVWGGRFLCRSTACG